MKSKGKIATGMFALAISASLVLGGCSSSKLNPAGSKNSNSGTETIQSTVEGTSTAVGKETGTGESTRPAGETSESPASNIDLGKIKPNEAGKIMVVMFHNFVDSYKSGDKYYTTTFDAFRQLLNTLYESGYRLVSLNDFINNNINVPAGCIPMVFTFDDGTKGQFNLADNNGKLETAKDSAVGIMEEFNKTHPDFGLKGTFYVNLGDQAFPGAGTEEERLRYLTDKGFELGNHTLHHINLKKAKTAEEIQMEIGGNQKKLTELLPGYTFQTFSLPFGLPSKDLQNYVHTGEYEGVKYDNKGIMEVGWDPSVPPQSKKFNPLSIHRVRATGIVPVEADLEWWLKKLTRKEQYVSDGNPETITVPKGREDAVDSGKLGNKRLVTY